MKKDKVKTCISLDTENVAALEKMSQQCGISKSDIINALIKEAYETNRELVVRYKLG